MHVTMENILICMILVVLLCAQKLKYAVNLQMQTGLDGTESRYYLCHALYTT